MPKQGKTPKKKTKEKSPQRTEESEYPAMDEETYNRLLRNAIEHSKAELQQQLQQQHEEQLNLKAVDVADFFSKLLEKGLFTKKDKKDPTTVFTDIHFEKKSIAHEAYHLSHGYCQ